MSKIVHSKHNLTMNKGLLKSSNLSHLIKFMEE